MSVRNRALRMGTFVALLTAMGCPTTTPTAADSVNTTVVPKPVSNLSPSPLGGGVDGTVTGPDGKPAGGANIIITDARVIEVPNAAEATAGADGKFTMRPVPLGSPWYVIAQVNGTLMASLVLPVIRQDGANAHVDITVASTMAAAGIAPLFIEDPNNLTQNTYRLSDLSIDKFNALVAAVSAAQPTTVPSKKLRDLTTPFLALRDKDAGVAAAYKALFDDLQANTATRLAGGTARPIPASAAPVIPVTQTGTPTPLPTATPTPVPTATPVRGATGTATPTPIPTATPTATPVPVPTPTKNYSPLVVTLDTTETATLTGHAPALGTAKFSILGTDALLFPDDSRIVVISSNALIPKSFDLAALLHLQPGDLTGVAALAVSNNTIFACGQVSGVQTVISLTIAGVTPVATSHPITVPVDVGITGITGLAFSTTGSTQNMLIASDHAQNDLLSIDPTTGAATVYGGINSSAGGKGSDKGAATAFGLSSPTGLMIDGTNLFVCDAANARIVKADLTANTLEPFTGTGQNHETNGTLAQASFNHPIAMVQFGGRYYVADDQSHTIRLVDVAPGNVYQFTDEANSPFFIRFNRTVGELNGQIYGATNDGKIVKFAPVPPPP